MDIENESMLDRIHREAESLSLDPCSNNTLDYCDPSLNIEFGLMFPTYEDYSLFIGDFQQRMSAICDERKSSFEELGFDWETYCKEKIVHNRYECAYVLDLNELKVDYEYDEETEEYHVKDAIQYPAGVLAFWDTICSNDHMCEAVVVYQNGDDHDIFYYCFGLNKGLADAELMLKNTLHPYYTCGKFVWGFKPRCFYL